MNNTVSPKIKQRICKTHNLPEILICLACNRNHFFCISCITTNHSNHVKSVYSMSKFMQYFTDCIDSAKDEYIKVKEQVSIFKLIREKRQQVDRFYAELIEYAVRKLNEQKKKLDYNMQLLEKGFMQNQMAFKQNLEQRINSLQYLIPYAQDNQLLQIKLKTSSPTAIAKLKQKIHFLNESSTKFNLNSLKVIKTEIVSNFNQQLQQSFLQKFNNFLKDEPVVVQPVPRRYHLNQVRAVSSRPCSNASKRNSSFSSGVTKQSLKQ